MVDAVGPENADHSQAHAASRAKMRITVSKGPLDSRSTGPSPSSAIVSEDRRSTPNLRVEFPVITPRELHWYDLRVKVLNGFLTFVFPCDQLHGLIHENLNSCSSKESEHLCRGSWHSDFHLYARRITPYQLRLIGLSLTPATLISGAWDPERARGWTVGLSDRPIAGIPWSRLSPPILYPVITIVCLPQRVHRELVDKHKDAPEAGARSRTD